MTHTARAWSLIALKVESRQYGGNIGYEDDLERTYRYDATVPNHKQIAEGDLVLIRDSEHLIGVARIERITALAIKKIRQRCPECGKVDLKFRKTRSPPWRCSLGHVFSAPLSEPI